MAAQGAVAKAVICKQNVYQYANSPDISGSGWVKGPSVVACASGMLFLGASLHRSGAGFQQKLMSGGSMKEQDRGDDLPSLHASRDDGFEPAAASRRSASTGSLRAEPPLVQPARSNGPLWALCAALSLALIALGYWTYQQQAMLKQQLVATQTSFARISEEASGRIQDITGKVSATESSLSEAEQARNARVMKLESQLAELKKTQGEHDGRLSTVHAGSSDLGKQLATQQTELAALAASAAAAEQTLAKQGQRLDTMAEQLTAANTALSTLQTQLSSLGEMRQQLSEQTAQLASQQQAVQALQSKGNGDIEQSLLIMRTELDQRAAQTEQALDAIDSFRLQTNRSISTLQNQLAALHAQVQGN
jgi:predicted  nucleic acid-binding Zn-ribbon protein